MVMINQPVIINILLRHGQLPLGANPNAEAKLQDVEFNGNPIPQGLIDILIKDDIWSLSPSYGDPSAGDPAMFDFIRIKASDGSTKEIEIFNMAILIFRDNNEETRRLFRIVNAIKMQKT